jgi:hypothetical protein
MHISLLLSNIVGSPAYQHAHLAGDPRRGCVWDARHFLQFAVARGGGGGYRGVRQRLALPKGFYIHNGLVIHDRPHKLPFDPRYRPPDRQHG